MQGCTLGKNGPALSAIGIGAMSFADFYGPTDERESHAIMDAALEFGISHLDTSNIYGMGKSENSIGSFLAARGSGMRERFTIATKAGIARDRDTGRPIFDNSPEHLTQEIEASLKRLGVEAVDLFYVHRRDSRIDIEDVTETLAGLVKAGKTRAIGFSEIAPSSLRRASAIHPIAAVQSEYSLSTRFPELGLVQTCAELGATLVAFSPVGRGLLTDRPHRADAIAGMPFLKTNPRFIEPNLSTNIDATAPFRALAAEMGTSAAALAIAWLLTRGEHVLPIPGTRSVAHLKELAAGADLYLSEEDLARIDAVLPVGWAHGDRYSDAQWIGPERYC
ncbi:aldo/keto reductase [Sedimentitalea todarodis]|uniref:Aldo/keto reductase n=1 Tax=Sedimentitalea todarodis TaxID=1631240 RepID=A0ABU3VA72_9RHOB|nr:aldo/keto reductase [Sedimentitalea todarodis]MDU9003078.1 aldo/keto reductase [Sedimentitalea todarodis]